jgi:hypothetical protein
LLGAIDAGLDVAELRIVVEDVAERRLGLVELALALEIQRQVVDVLHHLVILRAQAEFVESHVELALALEGQAKHAVGLGGFRVGFFLAALGDEEALDRQQQMAHQQAGSPAPSAAATSAVSSSGRNGCRSGPPEAHGDPAAMPALILGNRAIR